MVVHVSSSSTWEAEANKSEFNASLVYKMSFRIAKFTQLKKKSVLKEKTKTKISDDRACSLIMST